MSDTSTTTITGTFATRREAEIAVEHLVQEYGLDRSDIFIEPQSSENSAGTKASGGDVAEGEPQADSAEDAALNGALLVSVDISLDTLDDAEAAFREAGATNVSRK
ncbi:hypothetical protein ACFOEZ_10000 [Tianweitania populi]|uniref:Uncharacterized protein n=1 Tax=Tianweitania populi TaxID=1607949 RepID=A0A8J3DR42_9HYPH|nr:MULTISPECIES: hypothetical protein [Tianweitania]GHD13134.1 hypothetical protein GCM10016234_18310 [Tianweitania populi]